MRFIEAKGLSHKFDIRDKDGNKVGENYAIDGVDFSADKGQVVAILGRNGSGKSTFARHLNGLLRADKGDVYIDGRNPARRDEVMEVRRRVGMVFQNPDNQIVGNTLAEDVGFGLENLGRSPRDIWSKVNEVLELTGLGAFVDRSTAHISGGQKQRLAIASAMAMEPECIVMDEATSMLDPDGAGKVLELAMRLNREQGITIIMVTHRFAEAMMADRVYIMDEGKIAVSGSPRDVLGDAVTLMRYGLEVPVAMRLDAGIPVDITFASKKGEAYAGDTQEYIAELAGVSYSYRGENRVARALDDISLGIRRGETVAVIGQTGSGKSTMLQLLNRLITPDCGKVLLYGEDVSGAENLKSLRRKIGYVFQFPESQLFESTVLKDVMYGPANFGMDKAAAEAAARNALEMVGIDEKYLEYSPFELSGGMKKRVALAGILAYEPEILILDEPACGLDGESRQRLFDIIRRLNRERGCTVIMVSHDMEDVFEMTERIVMLDRGRVVYDGGTREFFDGEEFLEKYHIGRPEGYKYFA